MGVVLSRSDLLAQVADARRAGRSIAFANGCFDLLHVGHVRYLAAAAKEADELIVAINDDESVRRLKGTGRPILSAADRAELLAALRFVDYVVIFPEPTVGPLLEAIRPMSTARAPTTRSTPFPNARSCAATAAASPSSAIPRTTRRAIFWCVLLNPPGES
jgi:rfaE bifunctional protein nucleotidyltransferase chain/domain